MVALSRWEAAKAMFIRSEFGTRRAVSFLLAVQLLGIVNIFFLGLQ